MKEKISYIKGLLEGLKSEKDSKELTIMSNVLEIISEMANSLEEIKKNLKELNEYIETVDKDLGELENHIYPEEEFNEIECPHCGEKFVYEKNEEGNGDEEISCPICHKSIFTMEN